MGIGGSVAGHSLKIAKEWELFGPLYLCSLLENKKDGLKQQPLCSQSYKFQASAGSDSQRQSNLSQ